MPVEDQAAVYSPPHNDQLSSVPALVAALVLTTVECNLCLRVYIDDITRFRSICRSYTGAAHGAKETN